MKRSWIRGHPAIFINYKWVYEDDKTDIPTNGGDARPCIKCGIKFGMVGEEVDPCLGVLPGVNDACCGHGIKEKAYISFKNGIVVRGFEIEEKQ